MARKKKSGEHNYVNNFYKSYGKIILILLLILVAIFVIKAIFVKNYVLKSAEDVPIEFVDQSGYRCDGTAVVLNGEVLVDCSTRYGPDGMSCKCVVDGVLAYCQGLDAYGNYVTCPPE